MDFLQGNECQCTCDACIGFDCDNCECDNCMCTGCNCSNSEKK